MVQPIASYEMWLIEKTDALGKLPPIVVSDDEVEDVTDAIIASGADCYVKRVTIH